VCESTIIQPGARVGPFAHLTAESAPAAQIFDADPADARAWNARPEEAQPHAVWQQTPQLVLLRDKES
jgi:hypothetical protein